ncbi:uncharacterized protein LOC128718509 [Anopheles marshallii]|uniref:uncharacterized protein LOC128718509 n=1 Tax=Anopheles marshallii TaxID=1521116 RepID=UPI00237A998F|nr:uncharacterized protein LOC128718509 [Anopheles marshallii]
MPGVVNKQLSPNERPAQLHFNAYTQFQFKTMAKNSKSGPQRICVLCPNRSTITDTQTDDAFERITYHRFPTNTQRLGRWLELCGLSKESMPTLANKFVCSNHFAPECFERDLRAELLYGTRRMALKKEAEPTIRTPKQQLKRQLNTQSSEEEDRQKRKEQVDQLLNGQIPVTEKIANPFRKRVVDESSYITDEPAERNLSKNTLSHMSQSEMMQLIEDLQQETTSQQIHIAKLQRTIDSKTEKINFAKAEMVNTAISLQELKDHENRHVNERITEILSGRFGEGQLATILAGPPEQTEPALLHVLWTENELAQALRLICVSKEAYELIRKELRYPLPDASQIERWIHSVYLETGHNTTAMRILQLHAFALQDIERICSLHLTRINVPVRHHYDCKRDQIIGPNAQLHCLTVQGIFASWQQIVHIEFDLDVSKVLVEKIITDLHEISYNVVAITTDCDRATADIWRTWNVSNEQHCIQHPITGHSIYVYACPDRTLVAIHRALIDEGFLMQENNLLITRTSLMPFLNMRQFCEPGETSSTLYDRYISKMVLSDVSYESTLSRKFISSATTNALRMLANDKEDDEGVLSTLITLIDLFVDWYELCTATSCSVEYPAVKQQLITNLPYGVYEDEQNIVLDGMYDVMETIRCLNTDHDFLPQAVLMSINSMRKLLADLRTNYPGQINGIPMLRLSTIPFSETIRNLRQALHQDSQTSKVRSVNDVLFHLCATVVSMGSNSYATNILLQRGGFLDGLSLSNLRRQDDPIDSDIRDVAESDACNFLARFIVARLGHKYENLGNRPVTIEHNNDQYVIKSSDRENLSCITPSMVWAEQAKTFESYLRHTIQDKTPDLAKSLIDFIAFRYPQLGRDLVELYVRKRIAIKLKNLNATLDACAAKKQLSS